MNTCGFVGNEKLRELQSKVAKYFNTDIDNVKIQQQNNQILGTVETMFDDGTTEVQHFRIKN